MSSKKIRSFFSKIENQFLIFFIILFTFKLIEVINGVFLFPILHAESVTHRINNINCLMTDFFSLYSCEETYFPLVYLFSSIYIHFPFVFIPLPYAYFIFIIVIGICYYFFFKIFREIAYKTDSADYINIIAYPMFFLIFIDIYAGNSYGFALLCLVISYRYIQKNRNFIAALFYALSLYRINFLLLFPIFFLLSKKKLKFFVNSLFWALIFNLPMIIFPSLTFDYISSIFSALAADDRHVIAPIFPTQLLIYYPSLYIFFRYKKEQYLIPFLILFNLIIIAEIVVIFFFSGIIIPYSFSDVI